MLSEEKVLEIKNLFKEGWKIGTIATHLRVHHDTVKKCLEKETEPLEKQNPITVLSPWLSLIDATLEKHPQIRATRLLQMLKKRGYSGSVYPVRRYCQTKRCHAHKAYLDLKFTPGEMMQVDWASFGSMAVGKHSRKVHLFIAVLGYSRKIFAYFFHDMSSARVLEGHVLAFAFFNGCPREVLYDNMKTAVIEHIGEAVRFNNSLLELAQHYTFLPRACNPRSGWEKGRVERAVRYVRENFFTAREFNNLNELNAQLQEWLVTETGQRNWPDDKLLTVDEVFQQENLMPLPHEPFDPYEERIVRVDKKAMIQFDTNRYPVDPSYAGKNLTLRATYKHIRIMNEKETIHKYERLWTKHEILEVAGHQEKIAQQRKIKGHRAARSALEKTIKCGKELLVRWAELHDNLHQSSQRILELVKQYGVEHVEAACQSALNNGTPRSCSIAKILTENVPQPSPAKIHLKHEIPESINTSETTSAYDELYS